MNALQQHLKSYIVKLLGITVNFEPWSKATALPRFLFYSYDFYYGYLAGLHHLFMFCKNDNQMTPAAIKKHIALIKDKFLEAGEIVYVSKHIAQHNRSRLIEYKIPFIIPDNQLFLPGSGMALREYFRLPQKERTIFSPSTQVVVLNAIINGNYNSLTATRLVHELNYSAMTLTRAIDEIAASGLGVVACKGRERILLFTETKRALWEKAQPFLRSPVKQTAYLYSPDKHPEYPKAGLSALALQTMLAEPEQTAYALSTEQFKTLQKQKDIKTIPDPEAGALCIEVWRYAPDLLGKNNFVDTLSLYLSLKDSSDERVIGEAQTLLEGFFDTGN